MVSMVLHTQETKMYVLLVMHVHQWVDFLVAYNQLSDTKLGSVTIRCALKRVHDLTLMEKIFFGSVVSANSGHAPASQAPKAITLKYVLCAASCASDAKDLVLFLEGNLHLEKYHGYCLYLQHLRQQLWQAYSLMQQLQIGSVVTLHVRCTIRKCVALVPHQAIYHFAG
ncbi:hypothetical protein C5167_044405 [Papaver somniferum]|uniref:Uncharacterized protein n=1 Tax=Papaver somniferum TaxID=3469 RepID=A0A4Y7LA02_PAPSO|nr:hypothetical protein C5167_044405 [Papaver somniferum]